MSEGQPHRGNRQRSHGGNRQRPDRVNRHGDQRGGRGQGKGRRLAVGTASRKVAYDVLRAVSSRDAYANLVLPERIVEAGLDQRDAALATELTYGTLRATGLLDAIIDVVSDRPVDSLDADVLDAVRLGAYQLLRTRIAPHAAVSATVGATYGVLSQGQSGFVNALLRKIGHRSAEEWVERVAPRREDDPIGYLAMRYSHPKWITSAFRDALGGELEAVESALAADNERPVVHLAARPGRTERDLLASQVGGTPGRYSPYAVYLQDGGDPARLPAVRTGSAAVQDEGSQLAALALANAPLDGPDETWVDLCAGPGGKAALLGALAAERGARLTAIEPSEHRARLVEQAVRGLPVEVVQADGREAPIADGSVDRLLVDAPCSGLGSLRRRPESRWRRTPGDLPGLTKLQRELIAAGLRYLRPGGMLAYVTCSPHVAETRAQLRELDPEQTELIDVRPMLDGVPDLGDGPAVQLWPHLQGTDAMFISLIAKRST
ncbi:transcription antitermination factor NusB [Epidermidibacterium keratini]|nr:transcription antitermination factor NusB [Epidermidibacterium keratini]